MLLKGTLTKKEISLSTRQIAKRIAQFASDTKAEDILVLDMRKVVNFCDYFVICSGTSTRHARAIADEIEDGLADLNLAGSFKQSLKQGDWIIFDTGDVVIHIFLKATRAFYQLEYLWQEATKVHWE